MTMIFLIQCVHVYSQSKSIKAKKTEVLIFQYFHSFFSWACGDSKSDALYKPAKKGAFIPSIKNSTQKSTQVDILVTDKLFSILYCIFKIPKRILVLQKHFINTLFVTTFLSANFIFLKNHYFFLYFQLKNILTN